jgi:hypothetical protein
VLPPLVRPPVLPSSAPPLLSCVLRCSRCVVLRAYCSELTASLISAPLFPYSSLDTTRRGGLARFTYSTARSLDVCDAVPLCSIRKACAASECGAGERHARPEATY